MFENFKQKNETVLNNNYEQAEKIRKKEWWHDFPNTELIFKRFTAGAKTALLLLIVAFKSSSKTQKDDDE